MNDQEKRFSDYLTDIYWTVIVCGYEMDSWRVLYECDPTAFRCAMNDMEFEEEEEEEFYQIIN